MSAAQSNKGLGKGLDALLGGAAAVVAEEQDVAVTETQLDVEQLQPSDVQPRRVFDEENLAALAESIRSQGVLQPLLVRLVQGETDKYEIIAGERRWRASQRAGLTKVPVIIREFTDAKALEVALVENVQRADLNPIDEAAGYLRLVNEFDYTHEEMARVTGKSRSHITNLLRLLALPDKIKEAVSNNLLTMGHARALLGLTDDTQTQLRAAQQVIKNRLSVRETEELVRRLTSGEKSRRGRKPKDPQLSRQQEYLNTKLGMQVHLKKSAHGEIEFKLTCTDAKAFEGFVEKLNLSLPE